MPEASPQQARQPEVMLDESQGQPPMDTVPGSPECLKETSSENGGSKSEGRSQGTPPRRTKSGLPHSPMSSASSLPSSYASGSSVCCLKLLVNFWMIAIIVIDQHKCHT